MTRLLCFAVVVAVVCVQVDAVNGQDAKDAAAVIDKAIKALGGEDKLAKAKAMNWTAKVKFRFGGNESEGTLETTVQDLNHIRRVFEGQFGDNPFRAVTVVAGDKGWRVFGDNAMELDTEALANEKRRIYLSVLPVMIRSLKGDQFKTAAGAQEQINGKPANVLKVTPRDGKPFALYFDQQSGLLVKQVADIVGFQGEEYTQETTYSDYKDFDGIKMATKLEAKRDGETFQELTVTDLKLLDKVDPKTFAEPE